MMKGKKVYLIIAIFVVIVGSIVFFNDRPSKNISYITVTTKFYTKNTKSTVWSYEYTTKYNETTHKWDFTNSDLYVFKNGKWERQKDKTKEFSSSDDVASVQVESKSKGAYSVQVEGSKGKEGFFDNFLVDCSTSKVTELVNGY